MCNTSSMYVAIFSGDNAIVSYVVFVCVGNDVCKYVSFVDVGIS